MDYNGLLIGSFSRSAEKKSENDLARVEAQLNLVECGRYAAKSNAVVAAFGCLFVIAKEREKPKLRKISFRSLSERRAFRSPL